MAWFARIVLTRFHTIFNTLIYDKLFPAKMALLWAEAELSQLEITCAANFCKNFCLPFEYFILMELKAITLGGSQAHRHLIHFSEGYIVCNLSSSDMSFCIHLCSKIRWLWAEA